MKNCFSFYRFSLLLVGICSSPITQADILKTVDNLDKAHLVEANAYNKYIRFAEQADKEGYSLVAKLFRSVAFSELMHSRNHAAAIEGLGGNTHSFTMDSVKIGSTKDNLESAAKDERKNELAMYSAFMVQAEKDGLREAKNSFKYAADSELQHKQLLEKSFSFLGPKNMDYYVDVKSGETIEVKPGDMPPQSKLIDGAYVKAAN